MIGWGNAGASLLEALTLAALLAFAAWTARAIRRIKAHRDAREVEQDLTRDALLGHPGNAAYGMPPVKGLIDTVETLCSVVDKMAGALGSNGGSTVFDGLDTLRAGQADLRARSEVLLSWAKVHTDDGNAIVEAMDHSGRTLAAALDSAGIDWDPHKVPPFTAPGDEKR